MKRTPTVTKTIKKDYAVIITADEIRKRFRLPEDAVVAFRVPTGGDYSGENVIVEDGELAARWIRTDDGAAKKTKKAAGDGK